jgi:hypothetical protein
MCVGLVAMSARAAEKAGKPKSWRERESQCN